MLQSNQKQKSQPTSVWMIKGTCGACKSFEVAPNETELAGVQCSNKDSKYHGTKPGILQVNGCANYEQKQQAPEGFVLV